MSEFKYPNEPADYRKQRNALLDEEVRLRGEIEKVAERRRALPLGGPLKEPYEFERMDAGGKIHRVPFADLFESHDTLLFYSMMYGEQWDAACPSCTNIVDGLEVAARSVRQTAAIAVVAGAGPEQMRDWAKSRHWTELTTVSGRSNSYLLDYAGFPGDDPGVVSAMNVFRRTPDGIFHFWASELVSRVMDNGHPRHMDMVWPLWNLLDLTPEGRGTAVVPKADYEHKYFSKHILGENTEGAGQ